MYVRYFKRLFDIILSLLGILVLLVPTLVIASIVILTSGRPVFFKQKRVGKEGNIFLIVKFRTMKKQHKNNLTVTVSGDERITMVGYFLRKWKLDELPQLWNVLCGEMSFVGPRPDVEGYADKLQGADREILDLRPGITGPSALKYNNEEEILASQEDAIYYNDTVIFPDKVKINLEYLKNCSIKMDLFYLRKTILLFLKK